MASSDWLQCKKCGLNHRPRDDGCCPRCEHPSELAEFTPPLALAQPALSSEPSARRPLISDLQVSEVQPIEKALPEPEFRRHLTHDLLHTDTDDLPLTPPVQRHEPNSWDGRLGQPQSSLSSNSVREGASTSPLGVPSRLQSSSRPPMIRSSSRRPLVLPNVTTGEDGSPRSSQPPRVRRSQINIATPELVNLGEKLTHSLSEPEKPSPFYWFRGYRNTAQTKPRESEHAQVMVGLVLSLLAAGASGSVWAAVVMYFGQSGRYIAVLIGVLSGWVVSTTRCSLAVARFLTVVGAMIGVILGYGLITRYALTSPVILRDALPEAQTLLSSDEQFVYVYLYYESKRGEVPEWVGQEVMSLRMSDTLEESKNKLERLSDILGDYKPLALAEIGLLSSEEREPILLIWFRDMLNLHSLWALFRVALGPGDIIILILTMLIAWVTVDAKIQSLRA